MNKDELSAKYRLAHERLSRWAKSEVCRQRIGFRYNWIWCLKMTIAADRVLEKRYYGKNT